MDFSIDTAFDCPSALEQTKEEHKEVEIKPVKSDLAHKGMSRITSDPIIDFQGLLATTLDLQFGISLTCLPRWLELSPLGSSLLHLNSRFPRFKILIPVLWAHDHNGSG